MVHYSWAQVESKLSSLKPFNLLHMLFFFFKFIYFQREREQEGKGQRERVGNRGLEVGSVLTTASAVWVSQTVRS